MEHLTAKNFNGHTILGRLDHGEKTYNLIKPKFHREVFEQKHKRSCIGHKQNGAVEACWAHNPEVRGSKPRSANLFIYLFRISDASGAQLSPL